jgi:hypothetical protein
MSSPPLPMDNSSAIADSKLPPGEDYEEIREQVGFHEMFSAINHCSTYYWV